MCSRSRATRMTERRPTSTRRSAGHTRPSPFGATWPSLARSRGAYIRICASGARGRFRRSTWRCARSGASCPCSRPTGSEISSGSSSLRRKASTLRSPCTCSARAIRWSSRSRPCSAATCSTRPRTRSTPATAACSSRTARVARPTSEKAAAFVPFAPRIPWRRSRPRRRSSPNTTCTRASVRSGRSVKRSPRATCGGSRSGGPGGPVPLELDQVWPMCQTIVPEAIDLEALEAAEVFFRDWAAGAGFPFGILWEGETTLDDLRARAPGGRAIDWNALRIRATADFQFGRGAADALFAGAISYVISRNTGKVRNVLADGEHVVSLRAADGLFTLKAAGARRLAQAFPLPRLRIVVDEDSVPFHREGKNVFAKFVREADPDIRPGDEALVVSPEDELCAVARATMNGREMLAFKRGVAAHVREGVPRGPSAPRR